MNSIEIILGILTLILFILFIIVTLYLRKIHKILKVYKTYFEQDDKAIKECIKHINRLTKSTNGIKQNYDKDRD